MEQMFAISGVRHRFVDAPRLRWHVAEAGEGEPVLLLHGWPQHWWAWRKVIPLLACRYRVICPDLRGSGWTQTTPHGYRTEDLVDDVLELLDVLDLPRVLLAGHDLGGRIGFHLCLRAPGRVRGLVTAGAMHPFWNARALAGQAWRFWWTPLVETPLLGRTLLRHVPALGRLVFRLGGLHGALSADEVEAYAASAREPAHALAGERLMSNFAYREIVPILLGRYRSQLLRVPTVMLHGARDRTLGAGALRGYEDHADDLRVRLVPDTGHWLPEQRPAEVARALGELAEAHPMADDPDRSAVS